MRKRNKLGQFEKGSGVKGQEHNRYTHGMSHTRPHNIWTGMLNRCRNPKVTSYPRYGGQGIKVCERWQSFDNFWEDMEDGYTDEMTVDRIDGDKDYSPENCRWVSAKEQLRHKSTVPRYEYKGEKLTIPQLAKICGLSRYTLRDRLLKGLDLETAMNAPLQSGKKFK